MRRAGSGHGHCALPSLSFSIHAVVSIRLCSLWIASTNLSWDFNVDVLFANYM
uniref:Uncharacterized protein n=1 Tax=Arundo donax TaxID=35708 RepID=A0A0A8Y2W9_ARUDO